MSSKAFLVTGALSGMGPARGLDRIVAGQLGLEQRA